MNPPARLSPFPSQTIEAIAGVLGATNDGLTNAEIQSLLAGTGIKDPVVEAGRLNPMVRAGLAYIPMSKRERIRQAIALNQERTGTGNSLVAFVTAVMNPQSYVHRTAVFEERQQALNDILIFVGLRVTDQGKIARTKQASTLSEAAQLAGRLTAELARRGTHPAVLVYCTEEVLARNTFHAALEATKGVFDRLRALTQINADGATLVQSALSSGRQNPPVAINPLTTESHRSEQTGFMNMLIGLFGMYRNPTAHDPKIVRQAERPITEPELLELFTTLSMVHHTLDRAQVRSLP